ncbi:hypothetical protein TRIATDRAFT_300608 [Trichoderma atroviride IMI 206040]|uniref:Uncharacterized protein n=1 Tax=Hypocrea atroviridis (strain ATCC 20476 / IMI 206040) TaxID=452589 RepID=G9NY48_HYPAI|nr:uncharacterized protein TRIATDRAFT_300608 [Trichoderma atroviride IMI 206040]EHK44374.1 hypothetical protein TRIATDRAFT_300608 [Trichoderma atroviride IMI 206040]
MEQQRHFATIQLLHCISFSPASLLLISTKKSGRMALTEQFRSVIGPRARQKFAKIAAVPRLHLKAIMSFMQYAGASCGAVLQRFSAVFFSSSAPC